MNDEIKVKCKKCGVDVSYSVAECGGKIIDCPHCQQKIQLPSQLEIEFCSEFLKENSYFDKLPKNKSELTAGKGRWPKQKIKAATAKSTWVVLGVLLVAVIIFIVIPVFFFDDLNNFLDRFQSSKSQTASPQQSQPIVVKGFYIGMSEDNVRQVGKDLYGWSKGINETDTTTLTAPSCDMIEISYLSTDTSASLGDIAAQFIFDTNHNLKEITMGYVAVNNLFNSSNLNTQEFVQKFASAYNIPEFKHRQTPNGYWEWVYVSPDNIEFDILDAQGTKGIQIDIFKQDVTDNDINKSFN